MAILKDNEYTEFEGRGYINPQVSLDESNAFIDNLRSTQQANNQQIKTDTYNLGTAVPSNLGGLTGGEGYFTSRYQTPQINTLVNDLRTTAQANALSQVLANEQAKMKKRYNDAYNAAKIRNANPGGGGDGEDDDPNKQPTDEDPVTANEKELILPESTYNDPGNTNAITGGTSPAATGSIAGVIIDKNGNRTGIKVYPGRGIELPNGMSYNKDGAREFLQNWVRNGGEISNGTDAPNANNYSLNMLNWDMY